MSELTTDPISELIALNIQSTVAAITHASDGLYRNTVVSCDRPNPGLPKTFGDLECTLVQGNPQIQESRPQQHREWLHPFQVVAYVVESEISATAIDARLNTIRADIEKALMQDRTRGGYAINTEPDSAEFGEIDPDAHTGWVSINFNVRYRTSWNNPYTQT